MVAFDREGPVGESLAPVVDKLLVETQRATRLADVVARRLRAPGKIDIYDLEIGMNHFLKIEKHQARKSWQNKSQIGKPYL